MAHGSNYFLERHRGGEIAVIVHPTFAGDDRAYDQQNCDEFCALVDAAALSTVELVTSHRHKPTPNLLLGKGKVDEIAQLVTLHGAEVVIINHTLTPAQGRNLEEKFQCRVLDRTELILDIFAQRARSYEGKLQVELAQLKHLSTCLVHGWTHLERQKGGIGLRGPGEKQLESDRRLVAMRIKAIKKRLEKVEQQRHQGRRARQRAHVPTIVLVGYTNAGKSTLFNALTDSDAYVADQLFATLDTTMRQITLSTLGPVILADTVGFVQHLPHDLVAAFHATLEEACEADLLLHVVDSTTPDTARVIEQVSAVLAEIGASDVPQLLVMNKIDALPALTPHLERDEQQRPRQVWVSAKTQQGFSLLRRAIVACLVEHTVQRDLLLKPGPYQAKLRAKLYDLHAVIKEWQGEDGACTLRIRLPRMLFEQLQKQYGLCSDSY